MRKLMMLATMLAMVLALAAPAMAQDLYDCHNFVDQGQAQEQFNQLGPNDPSGLDDDGDNIACEDLPTVSNQQQADRAMEQFQQNSPGTAQYEYQDPAQMQYPAQDQYQSSIPLPETGGPGLLPLAAGALLIASGVVARRLFR